MEDGLVGNVALTIAGDGLDEFNEEEIEMNSCGSDEGTWTLILVNVVGTIELPRPAKGKTIFSKKHDVR